MLPPPENIVFELPGREGGCPLGCRHCIHQNVTPSPEPDLSHDEILSLLQQGRELGVEFLNIYPHNDDICLPPAATLPYLAQGQELGYKVKTVTNGVSPEGVERLLPLVYRLALSVDALDEETYGQIRSREHHRALRETLRLLQARHKEHDRPLLTALLMVNQQSLDSVERRVAELYELGIFAKIKLLEMLPLGGGATLSEQTLRRQVSLARLARLKKTYLGQVRIGTPLWRIKNQQRGCRLGWKDLVIGPQGQLSGCTLLFYLNQYLGNTRTCGTLRQAWEGPFALLRHKERQPLPPLCQRCPFYLHDLCWGGCLARASIFGHDVEIARSCGLQHPKEAQRLFEAYLASTQKNSPLPFPLCLDGPEERGPQ